MRTSRQAAFFKAIGGGIVVVPTTHRQTAETLAMPSPRKEHALLRLLLFTTFSIASIAANAQVSTHIAYDEQIKKARTFTALDENMFGDKVSLQDGALSFSYEDVSVPTNSGLRVGI
jgi:hypothetical protein